MVKKLKKAKGVKNRRHKDFVDILFNKEMMRHKEFDME